MGSDIDTIEIKGEPICREYKNGAGEVMYEEIVFSVVSTFFGYSRLGTAIFKKEELISVAGGGWEISAVGYVHFDANKWSWADSVTTQIEGSYIPGIGGKLNVLLNSELRVQRVIF